MGTSEWVEKHLQRLALGAGQHKQALRHQTPARARRCGALVGRAARRGGRKLPYMKVRAQ